MDDEVTYITVALANWAQWSKAPPSNLGYPKKALMLTGGGGGWKTTADFCGETDQHAAIVIDTIIHDLEATQRRAIFNRWLGCKYPIRDYADVLMAAYEVIGRGMHRRGLV